MQTGRTQAIFAHSRMDVIPVLAGMAHLAFVWYLVISFHRHPLWLNLLFGCMYAVSISWNINAVSHNFIHNPYFTQTWMNKAFSLIESLAIGFSQTFYHWVHVRHHIGNSDRPDKDGKTIDWLSIYRYGKNGQPEPMLRYVTLSFFRDDLTEVFRSIRRKNKFNAYWGWCELGACLIASSIFLLIDAKAVFFFLPFFYLGHCLSSLNGYYEHLGGNPDVPMAWGVSSYNRLYNWLWFGNGYHAEHHFRPRTHWTQLRRFHEQIAEEQRRMEVHNISTCHALGFLAAANRPRMAT